MWKLGQFSKIRSHITSFSRRGFRMEEISSWKRNWVKCSVIVVIGCSTCLKGNRGIWVVVPLLPVLSDAQLLLPTYPATAFSHLLLVHQFENVTQVSKGSAVRVIIHIEIKCSLARSCSLYQINIFFLFSYKCKCSDNFLWLLAVP